MCIRDRIGVGTGHRAAYGDHCLQELTAAEQGGHPGQVERGEQVRGPWPNPAAGAQSMNRVAWCP